MSQSNNAAPGRKLNVYLCGVKTGELFEDDLLQLSFKYIDGAPQKRDGAPQKPGAVSKMRSVAPLSVRLPVRADVYPHAYAYPFFENLIPEGGAFEILTKDHASGNKVFSLLNRFGGDCAGAVAFYETAPDNKNKRPREISPAEIAGIIDRLPQDPLLTGIDNKGSSGPVRLSLAGAQSKFAVYKSEGKYYRSEDKYPTTHIIKIANKRFPDLLKNELFCMKLAANILSGTPEVELMEADGRPYLEIKRYDRCIKNGNVVRIHQEDFCQALGLVSGKKYQKGGGAKLKDCYMVINEFSENRLTDIIRFTEWIIFNYLIGNTDAHAKNLSLLHSDKGIRLAPFYDLLSTEVYPEKTVDHETAMLINGKGKYSSLRSRDFIALFENLGQNSTNMMKTMKDKFRNIVPVAEKLRENLLSEAISAKTSIYDGIIELIKKRINYV